ncbi:MFS transporter [Paenibacillus paeoniae]|uniref:MFS transporter n=1 Tax=Paenibacillus paeoniae TaxID=2292705 RepID=A0A371PLJ2_9BACL|nr:MFS transporter [Paenibacillus paeoniae]REK76855.1 MFS transporter [Paenibacillus paeoniae]
MLRLNKSHSPQGDSRHKQVHILALITAISLLGDSMLYITLPIHWKEAGLISLVEVGILLSVNRFIRLPLNPVISWLYSKISIRTGLWIALIIAGTTTWLYGWAQSFVFWLILRSVWGMAWAILRLGAFYMIVEVSTTGNRGQVMGTFNGLSRIGGLVGMLGGGFFVEWFGIRTVALVFGLFAFLVIPLILHLPKGSIEHQSGTSKFHFSLFFKNPSLLKLLLTVFLVMLCLEGMVSATLSHLIHIREVIIDIQGVILSAAILASLVQAARLLIGVFVSPWIGGKSDGDWGRRRILIMALLMAALFIILTQFNIPDYVWLVNLTAALLTTTVLIVLLDSFASDIAEERLKAATISLYVMISDIGAAFGPVLGYLSVEAFGLSTTYLLSAAILLILSLLWILLKESQSTGMMMRNTSS